MMLLRAARIPLGCAPLLCVLLPHYGLLGGLFVPLYAVGKKYE